jgi:thiamine-phosphate pyrophosphorylase
MKSKKKLLKKSRLYVIIDKETLGRRSIFDTVKKISNKGVDIIQFRDNASDKDDILKNARVLNKLLRNTKTVFIINDYIDIAKIVDSDGVHLGQDDLSVGITRRLLGKDKIIGISCHNLRQAQRAKAQGADYISIGPLFQTPTKPEYQPIDLNLIKAVKKKIKMPFFVIGGINENNINKVLSYGAKRIVVCRAVCQAKNTSFVIKKLNEAIN